MADEAFDISRFPQGEVGSQDIEDDLDIDFVPRGKLTRTKRYGLGCISNGAADALGFSLDSRRTETAAPANPLSCRVVKKTDHIGVYRNKTMGRPSRPVPRVLA